MAIDKEKIRLAAEQETLLITLYSKVYGCPQTVFKDEKTRQILDRIDYDFSQLKVPTGTRLTVCLRAKKFDEIVREFLASHPQGVVLHLGCGLDTRFVRVGSPRIDWYDLDLPEVIDLREKFFDETDNYHMIPSSVTDLSWVDRIPTRDQDVLVVAEGLLMYLKDEQVKALVLRLKEAFPGCELAFDAYSTLTVRRVKDHPSIKKTGALIQWGIDDARQIEHWASGIRLKEEWFYTQSKDIKKLAFSHRLIFAIAGLFSVARKAHRILHYAL